MIQLPLFPLFIDLKDRKCVCIGGGRVAERKLEMLLEFGAQLKVISPEVTNRIRELSCLKKLAVIKKEYSEEDLEDAFLVIAATSDRTINERIHSDAVKRNIYVNVVDSPEECTFVFPAVVKRDDIIVGITTSGSYPALSGKIREKIQQLIPETFGKMLSILKEYRQKAVIEIHDTVRRKEFLNSTVDLIFDKDIGVEKLKGKIEGMLEVYSNEKIDQGRKP